MQLIYLFVIPLYTSISFYLYRDLFAVLLFLFCSNVIFIFVTFQSTALVFQKTIEN